MNNIIDILTVTLSVPAIMMCVMVLAHWLPESLRAARERRDAADWLVLGVMTSFAGILANISWWAVYWLMRILDDPGQQWWLDNGSFANLFTRQGAVIVAAFCHLKAYQTFRAQPGRLAPEGLLLVGIGLSGLLFILLTAFTGGDF